MPMLGNKAYVGMALIASAALGYCLHPAAENTIDMKAQTVKEHPAAVLSNKGNDAKVTALRLQVQNLEARLADSQKIEEAALSNAIARVMAQRSDRPPPGIQGRERLDELKKRNPEHFAQVTNRLAKMHQERKIRQEARTSFLSSVNTSNMSAQDKDTHDEYQQLLARREALEEQMHQSDITDDMRHELMDEIREVDQQMRTLGESERKVLLGEVAQAIGMKGDAAAELVQTVNDVFDATDAGSGPPGPPPTGAKP